MVVAVAIDFAFIFQIFIKAMERVNNVMDDHMFDSIEESAMHIAPTAACAARRSRAWLCDAG